NPVLSYWHYISSEDVCGFDFGFVVVNNSIVNTYNLCASNNTNGWVQKTVNLSAYAGQTVNLQIRAETDGYLLSSLYVDDVSFQSSVTTVQQSMNAFPLTNSTGVAQKQPNILSVEN
ncbi:MAG: immune inhibitor A, partial [Anaerolineae bacterium]|nr:immune inhibitor A [Anaerolineae bacterium]